MLILDRLTSRAVDEIVSPRRETGWLAANAAFRKALSGCGSSSDPTVLAAWQAAVERIAAATWELLMGLLDRLLRARGLSFETEVLLIPDGTLSALPLHMACTAGRSFLDCWAVSCAPSVSAFVACRRRASDRRLDGLRDDREPAPGMPVPRIRARRRAGDRVASGSRRFFYTVLLPDLANRGAAVVLIAHDNRYFHTADRVVTMTAAGTLARGCCHRPAPEARAA